MSAGARKQITVARLRGRDGDRCFYCGAPMRFKSDPVPIQARNATIEHLIDRSRGGTMHHVNAVLAHDRCNSKRSNIKSAAEKVASRAHDAPPIALAVRRMLANEAAFVIEQQLHRAQHGLTFHRKSTETP